MTRRSMTTQVLTMLLLMWGAKDVLAGDEMMEDPVMSGAHWRDQALRDLIPLWHEHVRDGERGAFYLNLSRNWQPMPPWDKVPAVLHFSLDGSGGAKRHYVSLVDDPRVQIREVRIDGQPWVDFDATQRSVMLPDREGLRVEVTLSPIP